MKFIVAVVAVASCVAAKSPIVRVHASAGSSFLQKYDDVTIDAKAASFLQKDLTHWPTPADASLAHATRTPIVTMQ